MFDLNTINIFSIIIRLMLSISIGGVIGYERERRREFAGMRTYMLIALGSTMAMMTNQYMFETISPTIDPARMAAQVISGIGFLGAGTILVIRSQRIKGLTTAAGLWATACVGIACGVGFYSGAVISGVTIILTIVALERFDYKIKNNFQNIWIYTEVSKLETFEYIKSFLQEKNIDINDMRISKEECIFQINILINLKNNFDLPSIINQLCMDENIITLREERNM